MADTIFKTQQGVIALPSADPEGDSQHIFHREYKINLAGDNVGAAAEDILIDEAQADIEVMEFYAVPSVTITAGANKPEFALAKGDLAAGALTEITSGASGRIDFSAAGPYNARTKATSTLSATQATKQVAKGQGLYLQAITNGTPADLGDTRVTFVVKYTLKN
jgi:hypothetical protein